MCTCEWVRFACGHEEKRRYISCTTLSEIKNSSECSCGSVNFTVIGSLRPCEKAECTYIECMLEGWACCKCKKGPNEGHVCKQDVKPWRWEYVGCGHGYCTNCTPWRDGERTKGVQRQKTTHEGPARKRSKKIRRSWDVIAGRS
ncbi:hypothetical protein SNK03_011962 [Fusarium graminearum]|nr:unnamed protein product [Fusarium graminearum]CZS84655.1 unnamed protein product [Fusarium graminearum]VTO93570.1 unnamed protein product [Fusarium graminearum]